MLLCVHAPDLHTAHFFHLPVQGRGQGWYFARPDGSRRGPARWLVMCEACFAEYAGTPLDCPFNADITWPATLSVKMRQAD